MTMFGSVGDTTIAVSYQPCVPRRLKTRWSSLATRPVSDQLTPPFVVLNTCEFVAPLSALKIAVNAYSVFGLVGAMAMEMRSTRIESLDTGKPVAAGVQVTPLFVDFRIVGERKLFVVLHGFFAHQRVRSQVVA